MFNHLSNSKQISQAQFGMLAQASQTASDELKKKDKEETRFKRLQKTDIQKKFEEQTQSMTPANGSFLS